MSWDLIEEAKKLISIPSLTNEGNRALVEYLAPFCQKAGFHLTLQGVSNGAAGAELNLLAHTRPEGSPDLCPEGLLMVTHLDTVPAGEKSLWTETGGDPFRATIKDDLIFGLGSADTKLDFLCKLRAIEIVGLNRIKIPFCLMGSYGEERALAGIRRLKESGLVHPRWGLISEPSEMQPVLRHKGILYMRAVYAPSPADSKAMAALVQGKKSLFQGKAAHGSTPHLGENAIEKGLVWLFEEARSHPNLQLLEIQGGTVHNIVPEGCTLHVTEGSSSCSRIQFLQAFWSAVLAAELKIANQKDPDFDPPVTTRNIGVIRGNRDRVEIEFDFRLIPSMDGNELFMIFQGLSRLPGVSVEVISSNAPMNTSPDASIARYVKKALSAVGLPEKFLVKSGNTEGAIVNQMGAEAIVIGPGQSSGNIHKPNEHNRISQLNKAVEFYTAFLEQFC